MTYDTTHRGDRATRQSGREDVAPSADAVELALQAGRVGVFEHDHSSERLLWSPIMRSILDADEDEAAALSGYLQRVPPEDLEEVIAAIRRAHAGVNDGLYDIEHLIRTRDGSLRRVSVRSRTFFGEIHGERVPIRTIGAVRDITERWRAEETARDTLNEEVARHTRELRSVLDAVPDALVIQSEDRTLRRCSASFEKVFGYSPIELIGQHTRTLYASDADDARIVVAWQRWRERGPDEPETANCRRKDGSVFPARILGNVIRDENGQTRGLVGLVRDITEELERRAALEQAQRLESLGRLTGGVAHDFNNILTVVVGNLELLEAQLDDPVRQGLVNEAKDAVGLGARLTHSMLAFAKRSSLESVAVDVNALVTNVVDMLGRTLGERIDLRSVLDPRIGEVRADRTQLESAVMNLAINARDAMPRGGRLTIETREAVLDKERREGPFRIPPGEYALLSVSDNGEGMSGEVLRRAAEPFFTTKEVGRGTGLGLSMVYGFVRQSGGYLSIRSDITTGTVVDLYLPRDFSTRRRDEPGPPEAGSRSRTGEIVLVIEDDPKVRRIAVAHLERLGYRTIEAGDGGAALSLLESERKIDVVFSDLVVPGEPSGLELVGRIRALRPGAALLLTSGYAKELAGDSWLEEGQLTLLPKPYRFDELAAALAACRSG